MHTPLSITNKLLSILYTRMHPHAGDEKKSVFSTTPTSHFAVNTVYENEEMTATNATIIKKVSIIILLTLRYVFLSSLR